MRQEEGTRGAAGRPAQGAGGGSRGRPPAIVLPVPGPCAAASLGRSVRVWTRQVQDTCSPCGPLGGPRSAALAGTAAALPLGTQAAGCDACPRGQPSALRPASSRPRPVLLGLSSPRRSPLGSSACCFGHSLPLSCWDAGFTSDIVCGQGPHSDEPLPARHLRPDPDRAALARRPGWPPARGLCLPAAHVARHCSALGPVLAGTGLSPTHAPARGVSAVMVL